MSYWEQIVFAVIVVILLGLIRDELKGIRKNLEVLSDIERYLAPKTGKLPDDF